jgi:hypothetical protein
MLIFLRKIKRVSDGEASMIHQGEAARVTKRRRNKHL